jgi:hypothetical protein
VVMNVSGANGVGRQTPDRTQGNHGYSNHTPRFPSARPRPDWRACRLRQPKPIVADTLSRSATAALDFAAGAAASARGAGRGTACSWTTLPLYWQNRDRQEFRNWSASQTGSGTDNAGTCGRRRCVLKGRGYSVK